MNTRDLDYDLPQELIAQHPLERRDQSRLMVIRRDTASIEHARFRDLPRFLHPGDLLVCNDTRVVPARFNARRTTGALIEGLFLRQDAPGRWEVLLSKSRRLKPDERLSFDRSPQGLIIESPVGPGRWIVSLDPIADTESVLNAVGMTPLPHYIHRQPANRSADDPQDRRRYQTVFARRPGAVAAPTAGLHFTDELLASLDAMNVNRATLTLHVGLGTFRPLSAETLENHDMHAEFYDLPQQTVRACDQARAAGRRVIAVGTTAARTLEACADPQGCLRAASGRTDLFIYPPYNFHAVDALITNFHLPRSTLLALVFAFASRDLTRRAYQLAIRERYRFYSYGDAMLIL